MGFLWLICVYFLYHDNDYQKNWGEGWECVEGRGGGFLFYIMYFI